MIAHSTDILSFSRKFLPVLSSEAISDPPAIRCFVKRFAWSKAFFVAICCIAAFARVSADTGAIEALLRPSRVNVQLPAF